MLVEPSPPPAAPVRPRPFLKWAGGKGQLLPDLLARVPRSFGTYHEPFVGGAALFFELRARGRLGRAVLSDANPVLVDTYTTVRDDVEGVIGALQQHRYDRDHFYAVRAWDPATLPAAERAARVLFLNRTCFNGLYRENSRGQFNVPFGRYANPTICDAGNLRAVAAALRGVEILRADFRDVLGRAVAGDLVYFDPPYEPVSATASFTAYHRGGFGQADQRALRDVFATLAERGVHGVLSNSDVPFVRDLYAGFPVDRVMATRGINSRGDRRGAVGEVIVRSHPA